jgi:hypothetical protein
MPRTSLKKLCSAPAVSSVGLTVAMPGHGRCNSCAILATPGWSIYRPLWNRPTASDLQNGRKLIQVAQTFDGNSQRERDYIDALAVSYGDDNRDYQKRSADYCDVMQKLF